jgi:hypothetical protein
VSRIDKLILPQTILHSRTMVLYVRLALFITLQGLYMITGSPLLTGIELSIVMHGLLVPLN